MRKMTFVCLVMLLTLAVGRSTFAQDAPNAGQATNAQEATQAQTEHYYHLEFVVEELGSDGKPVNSRTYSTTICTQPRSTMSIRTGTRIPIVTGSDDSKNEKGGTSYQYQDVGVNFDIHNAHEFNRQLAFDLTAAASGVAESSNPTPLPVIRQNRWQASVLVAIGKPTVVFASDSTDAKGGTRVLVTATLIQ